MFRKFPCSFLIVVGITALLAGCLEQYDPGPANKMFHGEYEQSKSVAPALNEAGELPVAAQPVSIDTKYQTFCASCHGATGGGDGPAGVALNPKARNFQDAQWQAQVDDQRIYNVIKSGGASVGISPMMAPWGGVLSDEEVTAMVAHVRSFKK